MLGNTFQFSAQQLLAATLTRFLCFAKRQLSDNLLLGGNKTEEIPLSAPIVNGILRFRKRSASATLRMSDIFGGCAVGARFLANLLPAKYFVWLKFENLFARHRNAFRVWAFVFVSQPPSWRNSFFLATSWRKICLKFFPPALRRCDRALLSCLEKFFSLNKKKE